MSNTVLFTWTCYWCCLPRKSPQNHHQSFNCRVFNAVFYFCYLQGPSASAYVTYLRSEDALRAIQAVNNIFIDGRTLKASLGTTKYCSHFMKNQPCPKNDCMYLHELGELNLVKKVIHHKTKKPLSSFEKQIFPMQFSCFK